MTWLSALMGVVAIALMLIGQVALAIVALIWMAALEAAARMRSE